MTTPGFWGDLICELRTQQNMSQRQLAGHTQVNRSTLRRIERDGDGEIVVIEKILNFLGYELEAVLLVSEEAIMVARISEEDDPAKKSKLALKALKNFRFGV